MEGDSTFSFANMWFRRPFFIYWSDNRTYQYPKVVTAAWRKRQLCQPTQRHLPGGGVCILVLISAVLQNRGECKPHTPVNKRTSALRAACIKYLNSHTARFLEVRGTYNVCFNLSNNEIERISTTDSTTWKEIVGWRGKYKALIQTDIGNLMKKIQRE